MISAALTGPMTPIVFFGSLSLVPAAAFERLEPSSLEAQAATVPARPRTMAAKAIASSRARCLLPMVHPFLGLGCRFQSVGREGSIIEPHKKWINLREGSSVG